MKDKITAGFIPLVDAAGLLLAADFGFAERQGLQIELIREVSWANVRERLSAGIFDVAHLLAPMAIASSLDLMPGSVTLAAPYVLATNGNAITVSEALYRSIAKRLVDGEITPMATAQALSSIVAERKDAGEAPLAFGTTFPFSCHTYQLRFWMAAAGIDTANDVRIAVLPPSYMVESLETGEVDGFCVGAPWNSAAVEQGLGHILHFGCEVIHPLTEKVLAARQDWIEQNEDVKDLKVSADASALKAAFEAKKAAGKEVKVAMTFPGGTHDLWLRYWLAAGGIDPDRDVSTIVVPPPQMVANMKVGTMDAFCVGEPWNAQLVNQGIGFTACTTGEIWFLFLRD
jgi:NitT/TauT family transport system ATP-binding protein